MVSCVCARSCTASMCVLLWPVIECLYPCVTNQVQYRKTLLTGVFKSFMSAWLAASRLSCCGTASGMAHDPVGDINALSRDGAPKRRSSVLTLEYVRGCLKTGHETLQKNQQQQHQHQQQMSNALMQWHPHPASGRTSSGSRHPC